MVLTHLGPWNKVKVIKHGYELLEQGYSHANFERPLTNSVHQKANILVQSENMSVISLEYVQKWKIVVHSLFTWLT